MNEFDSQFGMHMKYSISVLMTFIVGAILYGCPSFAFKILYKIQFL